jgi:hypothetical protein
MRLSGLRLLPTLPLLVLLLVGAPSVVGQQSPDVAVGMNPESTYHGGN